MALMRSKDIPKDAVAMNELDATTYVWEIVDEWKILSDTWALRYTPVVLGGINALSGLIINKHFRHKLKLGSYGYFSSAIPITVMPGIITALFHRHLISTEMLLMKNEACPICYEIKSAVIQCGFGIVYPMVLGPTSALMLSNTYSTYRTPDIWDWKVFCRFVSKLTKPLSGTLVFLSAFQLVASSALTYFEMKNNLSLRRKMLALENQVLSELADIN